MQIDRKNYMPLDSKTWTSHTELDNLLDQCWPIVCRCSSDSDRMAIEETLISVAQTLGVDILFMGSWASRVYIPRKYYRLSPEVMPKEFLPIYRNLRGVRSSKALEAELIYAGRERGHYIIFVGED